MMPISERYSTISLTPYCWLASLTIAPMTEKSPAATSIQSALIDDILESPVTRSPRASSSAALESGLTPSALARLPMPPKHAPATPTFEQALDELDTLVRRMESGELSLDESIAAYRRGAELARLCQARLAQAEQEIKQLEGDMLKPLDPTELRGAGS
jgi:exodeoxyribonuclease VII small subunit